MKVEETDIQPDGMLLTISEIFVDTYEEKDEILNAIKGVLKKQKKRLQKEMRDASLGDKEQ